MPEFASIYDCIIVGGGPAGLTCGIFLGRYRRRVLICDNGRPRNYAARGVHGFLGQHGIAPAELLARGREEARGSGVDICQCTVTRIERAGDHFEVTTTAGQMRARRVVLAYGVRDTLPEIPDIGEFYGASVFHCPDCDGYEVSDKRVGVIGRGKSGAALSLKLLQWTNEVTLFLDGRSPDIDEEMTSKLLAQEIAIRDEKVIALVGKEGAVEAAVLATGERVAIDSLFFAIAVERTCMLAEDLGCEVVEDAPNIIVDDYRETTVEGVYAIGDLVAGSQLAITSAADGAVAAIAINKSLLPPALRSS